MPAGDNSAITIRPFAADDWQILRAVRLRALQEHPDVFLGTYETAAARDEAAWRALLDGQGKCIFGLFDGDLPVGITAVFTWDGDPTGQTGILAMSYIAPDYRGRKLSRLLYRARIDWALDYPPWKKLVVSHREGNESSRRANQAFGFVFDHKKTIRWPDGMQAEEWSYTLDLEVLRKARSSPDL